MHTLAPEVQQPTKLPPCSEPVLDMHIIHQFSLHNLVLSTHGNTWGFTGQFAVVRHMQVRVAAVAEDVIGEAELSFMCARSCI